jgi:hypothetical protein
MRSGGLSSAKTLLLITVNFARLAMKRGERLILKLVNGGKKKCLSP